MNSTDVLLRAAASVSGPAAYSRHSDALVCLASMALPYSATGHLERANCRLRSGAVYCARGEADVLAEAKARVCRRVGYPHVGMWEAVERPTWQDVQRVFREAA